MTPITAAHRRRLAELAPAAIERLEAFGYRERRECAWALISGGLSPLLGFLAFDWPANAAAVVLCVNLAIALAGDWLRVLFAPQGLAAISRAATHDQFVFGVAAAIEIGRQWVNSKVTPGLEELDQADGAGAVLVLSPLGFGTTFFAVWLLMADAALHPIPATLVLGTLPTLLVIVGALVAAIVQARTTLRESGSVRIQTALANVSLVTLAGMYTVMSVGSAMRDPPLSPDDYVVFASAAVVGVGAWRLLRIAALRRMAGWLRQPFPAAAKANPPR